MSSQLQTASCFSLKAAAISTHRRAAAVTTQVLVNAPESQKAGSPLQAVVSGVSVLVLQRETSWCPPPPDSLDQ